MLIFHNSEYFFPHLGDFLVHLSKSKLVLGTKNDTYEEI